MKAHFIIILFLFVLVGGCKKKDFPPDTTINESGLYFKATIDAKEVVLSAGQDNYYFYASTQTENNLNTFSSELKVANCTDCRNRLKLTFYDYQYSSTTPTRIDSSIRVGLYSYVGASGWQVQFSGRTNQVAKAYFWNFGDGSTSNEQYPLHTYAKSGKYLVALKITSSSGCEQYMTRIETIKDTLEQLNISSYYIDNNTLRFQTNINDTTSGTYLWDFGDGSTSTLVTPSHNYTIPGTYPVKLTFIRNSSLDTLSTSYNTATQTTPMPCLTNYNITSISYKNTSVLSKVVVEWTDENGITYRSDGGKQPNDVTFKILSVSDYEENEKGEKTKKINVLFDCYVFNGSRSKHISNAEATLCVSYK